VAREPIRRTTVIDRPRADTCSESRPHEVLQRIVVNTLQREFSDVWIQSRQRPRIPFQAALVLVFFRVLRHCLPKHVLHVSGAVRSRDPGVVIAISMVVRHVARGGGGEPKCLLDVERRLHFGGIKRRERRRYTSKMDVPCQLASGVQPVFRRSLTFFKPVWML
jgi:hypothetical protein